MQKGNQEAPMASLTGSSDASSRMHCWCTCQGTTHHSMHHQCVLGGCASHIYDKQQNGF